MSKQLVKKTASQVAAAIRQIAAERNILRVGGTLRAAVDQETYAQSIEAFGDSASDVFERQSVTAISFNEKRNTVFIYTNKRVPKAQAASLPFNITDDVKIVYRIAKPLVVSDSDAGDLVGVDPYEIRNSAYCCGSSIGIGNVRTAGTLGALVKDIHGKLFGLSNNHVSGGCNNARVGLPIVGPGIMDVQVGHQDPFTLGWHHSVLQMRQGDPSAVPYQENTDAALIEIKNAGLVSSWQGQMYDTPLEVIDPEDDMEVEKVGRTTKHTTGIIDSKISGPFPVNYKSTIWHSPDDSTVFHGQVFFEPVYLISGHTGPFSLPGDSGSLVVTKAKDGSRKAVGLIFAGRAPNDSYMLPLAPILQRFGVTLVNGM